MIRSGMRVHIEKGNQKQFYIYLLISEYSKTCLKRPLKKKIKNYRLMHVKSIAECSILQ